MSRGKELEIILLDVNSLMQHHLVDVSSVLFNFALAKTLNKPAHEMAIIAYGSQGTSNSLNVECESDGSPDQYLNISVLQDLRSPGLDTLRLLTSLPAGSENADFVDALTVAVDLVIKASAARVLEKIPKKLTIISNFARKANEVDEEFQQHMVASMKAQLIQLQVVCLDVPPAAPPAAAGVLGLEDRILRHHVGADDLVQYVATQEENLEMLKEIHAEVGKGEIRMIKDISGLFGVFKTKEVSSQCVKAELEIGKTMRLRVRIYKKVSFEKLPPLKTKCKMEGGRLAGVSTSREYFKVGEVGGADSAASEPVAFESLTKAYRYGRQYVPMDEIREREMTYLPGKTLQLLGFVDSEPLRTDQRYLFIKDPQVLLPEQDDASMKALSGLVQAMHENKKAAIVRYARTDKAHVALCALLPQLGSATEVDHCVMLNLPFEEDIRTYAFPPLAPREELLPTRQQSQAAQTLVQTLDLTASGEEALQPETTANPTLQRFYRALGRLALGQPEIPGKEEELPGPGSTDKLVQASLTYQPSSSAARSAMAAFKSAFVTHEVVKRTYHTDEGVRSSADVTSEAAGMRASSVCLSEEYPVEEFQKLVGCGRLEEGVAALAERVHSLVDRSVKDRSYAKALACCTAMRQACVSADRATICNDFLQQIKAKYKEDSSHSDFWNMLCASNLTLISLEESSSSFVSGREAEAFTDVVARKAPSLQQKSDQVIILDDLEDME